MQFKSIISFFRYFGIDISDGNAFNISRAKKLANAEFAMSENGFITINQIVYNKQDIFAILEANNVVEIISYYNIVENSKGLNHFFESGVVLQYLSQEIENIKNQVDFKNFISPYFAFHFNTKMRILLQDFYFTAAAKMLPHADLIRNEDIEDAFQSTFNFLNQKLKLIKNLNELSYSNRKSEIMPWTRKWAPYFNLLPDIFYTLKEEFCLRMIEFCERIQYVDINSCYLISKQLLQLNFLSQTATETILYNYQKYEKDVLSSTNASSTGFMSMTYVQKKATEYVPTDRIARFNNQNNNLGWGVWLAIISIVIICIVVMIS